MSPEGTGYRAKTRFARFFNLPELISIFKEAADIQTADMLNLPVPEAEYINEVLKPSEKQKEMVEAFVDSIIIHGKYDYEIKLVYDDQFAELQDYQRRKKMCIRPEAFK